MCFLLLTKREPTLQPLEQQRNHTQLQQLLIIATSLS